MKTILFGILILVTAVLLYSLVQRTSGGTAQTYPFSRFLQEIHRGDVIDVTIADSNIKGRLKTGQQFKTVMPMDYPELINMLRDKQVVITGEKPGNIPWFAALISWAPFLLQIVVWIFFMRPEAERILRSRNPNHQAT
jgi:cell division protease FtsH